MDWHEMDNPNNNSPRNGDIRNITLTVRVMFQYSNKIVIDYNCPESDWVEYGSGFVMDVLPQKIVYNNEPSLLIANTAIA